MSPRTLNRLKLVGIGVLSVLPVAASYLLYWFWVPEQHTNYGTLIEPRRIPVAELYTVDNAAFSFDSLRGRWIMLVIDGGKCGPRCEEKLWQVRQVRQAQGKEMGRIERVWLIDDDQTPAVELAHNYGGTWMVHGGTRTITAVLPTDKSVREHVYLIDPLGNLMLRFPVNPEPKRMIKDLARLLKYSRSG